MTSIFGYGAMPESSFWPERPQGQWTTPTRTWLAAAVQGVGLDIYDAFLFGERSKMGGTLASSFGGLTFSSAGTLANLYHGAIERRGLKANAFRLFNHLPGINLFYIRVVPDYTMLNSFYEYLNPEYLRRMRRRVERENYQGFWHARNFGQLDWKLKSSHFFFSPICYKVKRPGPVLSFLLSVLNSAMDFIQLFNIMMGRAVLILLGIIIPVQARIEAKSNHQQDGEQKYRIPF